MTNQNKGANRNVRMTNQNKSAARNVRTTQAKLGLKKQKQSPSTLEGLNANC